MAIFSHEVAFFGCHLGSIEKKKDDPMESIFTLSFDAICVSFLACCALRESMIFFLPDAVAGPGGWFIDTGEEL